MSVTYTVRLKQDVEIYEGDITNKILFTQRLIDRNLAVDIFNTESRTLLKKATAPTPIDWKLINFGGIVTMVYVFLTTTSPIYLSFTADPHTDAFLVNSFWCIGGVVTTSNFYIGNDSITADATVEIFKAGNKT